jgi:IclR family transcriptional regulator, KDG regulon repressor
LPRQKHSHPFAIAALEVVMRNEDDVTSPDQAMLDVEFDASMEGPMPRRSAVDKALEVLAAFPPGHTAIGISELARELGLTKSTAFRLVATLERHGFVERAGGRYRLGTRLHELGSRVYESAPGALSGALMPFMTQLYEECRETVNLGVLRDGEVVLLGRVHGRRPVPRIFPPGSRFPAYTSALGKAMLAHAPSLTELVVARGLRPRTRDTIVCATHFRGTLAGIRESGIATNSREARPELSCVATALLDGAGRPIAALSVGGQTGRIDLRHSAELLRKITAEATAAARQAHRPRSQPVLSACTN